MANHLVTVMPKEGFEMSDTVLCCLLDEKMGLRAQVLSSCNIGVSKEHGNFHQIPNQEEVDRVTKGKGVHLSTEALCTARVLDSPFSVEGKCRTEAPLQPGGPIVGWETRNQLSSRMSSYCRATRPSGAALRPPSAKDEASK